MGPYSEPQGDGAHAVEGGAFHVYKPWNALQRLLLLLYDLPLYLIRSSTGPDRGYRNLRLSNIRGELIRHPHKPYGPEEDYEDHAHNHGARFFYGYPNQARDS